MYKIGFTSYFAEVILAQSPPLQHIVLRDFLGEWIKGYYKSIRIVFSLHAVLWSILVGLHPAWSMGVFRLQVQSDSSIVVRMVFDPMAMTSSSPLVRAIVLFSDCDWSIDFTWLPREQNMVVDSRSKLLLPPNYHLATFNVVHEIYPVFTCS
ncbi:hypothetical protein V6N11_052529 [Hibiscus sabdariffa]|uniref:RNase H type-1 domain-containing protein n=1 Tax=Hibiscus sabdariffa TaxID=183260 RepID=A0ABR2UAA7_9ROSI